MCNKQLERGSATGLRSKRFFQNKGLTGTMESVVYTKMQQIEL